VEAALDRDAELEAVYLGYRAEGAFEPLVARLRARDVPVVGLKEGVLERIGTTRTPQPVLAVAPIRRYTLADLGPCGPVVVAVGLADPGNLGTVMRGIEATGGAGLVTCGNSVDAHNPKAVRSSAGAVFSVIVVEAGEPVDVLQELARRGPRVAATPRPARSYERADLAGPSSLVLGNEAHGLPDEVIAELDDEVTIPMAGPAESLNVAMAATVLLAEAARQRRAAEESR
jgi:TrmH family RNA methyltransferase